MSSPLQVDGTLATYYNRSVFLPSFLGPFNPHLVSSLLPFLQPYSILFGMKIINVRRSGNMAENCTIQVGWQTTEKQLDDLEKSICSWLSTDEKRDIGASTAIMVRLFATFLFLLDS